PTTPLRSFRVAHGSWAAVFPSFHTAQGPSSRESLHLIGAARRGLHGRFTHPRPGPGPRPASPALRGRVAADRAEGRGGGRPPKEKNRVPNAIFSTVGVKKVGNLCGTAEFLVATGPGVGYSLPIPHSAAGPNSSSAALRRGTLRPAAAHRWR